MSQRRKLTHAKGRWDNRPRFVMLMHALLEHPAWRDLSHSAKITYIYLRKQKRTSDADEQIMLPYSDPDNPVSKRTFARSIRDLISHGFIELHTKGGLLRRANIYRLSDKWETWEMGTQYPYI